MQQGMPPQGVPSGEPLLAADVEKMMPKTPWIFALTIKSASSLPKMDVFGKADAYVRVRAESGFTGQTATIKKDYNPVWNWSTPAPLSLPKVSEIIEMHILLIRTVFSPSSDASFI